MERAVPRRTQPHTTKSNKSGSERASGLTLVNQRLIVTRTGEIDNVAEERVNAGVGEERRALIAGAPVRSELLATLDLGKELDGDAFHRESHVVVAEARERVVPERSASRGVEAEQMAGAAGINAPLLYEDGDVLPARCGEKASRAQLRLPKHLAGGRIDRRHGAVGSDNQGVHIAEILWE